MPRRYVYTRSFAASIITTLLLVIVTLHLAQATPSAILVYDHGFAKEIEWAKNGNLIPINKTSSFTQDDQAVYAYGEATFYAANLTWRFYDPHGQLYETYTQEQQCTASPCYYYITLRIPHNPIQTLFGRWRLDVFDDSLTLYTDYFYMNPVLTQVDSWTFSIESSTSSLVHGDLTVTVHPSNGTWSYYRMYMPYATNLRAFGVGSNTRLSMTKTENGLVVVNLGVPRGSGYTFTIDFNMQYGLSTLNGWSGGTFALVWQDQPWQRFHDLHPIYESFNITLPPAADLVDIVGTNAIALRYNVAIGIRQSIEFDTTVINEPFGWTVIYHDFAYRNSHGPQSSQNHASFNLGSGPALLLFPLRLSQVNIWSAVMAIFLLTASELASPIYERSGSHILVDRRRLRVVALILVVLFITTTAYQLMLQSNLAAR